MWQALLEGEWDYLVSLNSKAGFQAVHYVRSYAGAEAYQQHAGQKLYQTTGRVSNHA